MFQTSSRGIFAIGAFCLSIGHVVGQVQTRTTTAVVHGKSVQLLPSSAVFVAGVGNVVTYFSTFNGSTGTLLIDSRGGGTVSGELRARANTPGLYEGGYGQATPVAIVDYGSYTLNFPTTDADANGILDLIQLDRDGSFTATGSGFSALAGLPFSISVRFNRASGSGVGTYSAATQNAVGQTNTVTGTYSLSSYRGSVGYSRGATNTMSVSLTSLAPGATSVAGTTTFTSSGPDQLSYAAFAVRDTAGIAYQVRAGTLARSGNIYRGDLTLADGIPATSWADFTGYILILTDPNDADGNGIPDLTDPGSAPPVISGAARTQAASVGQSVTVSFTVSGAAAYQWSKNGSAIIGATSSNFTLSNVQIADAGTYTLTATNASGSVTSPAITLSVSALPAAPRFIKQPTSYTLERGTMAVLTCEVSGSPNPTLQWRRDGASIAGATSNTLVLPPVGLANNGSYTCVASNSQGTATSQPANIAISDTPDVGRLVNMSIRTKAGTGAETLITGFSISGGDIPKPILVRAAGPSLGSFGIDGALADPVLNVYAGTGSIAVNDNWGGDEQLRAAAAAVGAFAFASASSKDAALFNGALTTGSYTAQVTGEGGTVGIALAEIYDATPAGRFTPASSRLSNVSARAQVGTGSDILIAGFVVGGTTAKTLLIRAIGPTLGTFGVAGALADPKLELFAGSNLLMSNDDWAGLPTTNSAAVSVGAFGIPGSSKDAAILVTLAPGSYSAQMSGVGNTTGVGLLEVYEIPAMSQPQVPSTATVPVAGLLAYFPFEGDTADQSGNGYQATGVGSTQYVTGLSGRALRITGDNALFYSGGGHVRLPTFTAALNAGFSISLWVKDESLGGQPVNEEAYVTFGVLDQPKAEISLNSVTRAIGFHLDTGRSGEARSITRPIAIPADYGAWKHLVLTYVPGTFAAFFNGEKVGQQTGTFNVFPTTNAALGRHWWSGGAASSARMSATFDNVRVYSRALSDSEVLGLFFAEKPQ